MSNVTYNSLRTCLQPSILWKFPIRKNFVSGTTRFNSSVSNLSSPLALTFNSKPKLLNFNFSLSENVVRKAIA